MGIYEERQAQQAEDELYRRAAERMTLHKVNPHVTPHRVGDGAFVEVQVWVPKANMELERYVRDTSESKGPTE